MFSGGDASAIFGGQQQALENPPAAEGPSEFTRVFKSPPRESEAGAVAPQPNVAPTPPPPAPRPGIPPVVIAILGVLFFACLIAAGYLALKH